MFGNKIDYFGNDSKRRKMSRDLEKQQKIKVARDELKKKGQLKKDDDVFLDKDVVFEKVMSARSFPKKYISQVHQTPQEELNNPSPQKEEPLIEAVHQFIKHDRMDALFLLNEYINGKQRAQIEMILEQNKELFEKREKLHFEQEPLHLDEQQEGEFVNEEKDEDKLKGEEPDQ